MSLLKFVNWSSSSKSNSYNKDIRTQTKRFKGKYEIIHRSYFFKYFIMKFIIKFIQESKHNKFLPSQNGFPS